MDNVDLKSASNDTLYTPLILHETNLKPSGCNKKETSRDEARRTTKSKGGQRTTTHLRRCPNKYNAVMRLTFGSSCTTSHMYSSFSSASVMPRTKKRQHVYNTKACVKLEKSYCTARPFKKETTRCLSVTSLRKRQQVTESSTGTYYCRSAPAVAACDLLGRSDNIGNRGVPYPLFFK